jgi:hypothetical protein
MQTNAISTAPATALSPASTIHRNAWLMLISRSALFLAVQVIIAAAFVLVGNDPAWIEAARWWIFFVIIANTISIYLLVRLFRQEGKRYLDAIRFTRATFKMDLLWFVVALLLGLPIAAAPMNILGSAIFGDPMIPTRQLFQPLPVWALIVGILFPLTVAFAEGPTYFVYCMPRLAEALKSGWLAWLIASLALAAQHMFLPFIPDGRYLLWRFGMYLPFALFLGLVIKLRPTLVPYFMIVHVLIDLSALAVYLTI